MKLRTKTVTVAGQDELVLQRCYPKTDRWVNVAGPYSTKYTAQAGKARYAKKHNGAQFLYLHQQVMAKPWRDIRM